MTRHGPQSVGANGPGTRAARDAQVVARWRTSLGAASVVTAAGMLCACGSSDTPLRLGGSNQTLSVADFAGDADATVAARVAARAAANPIRGGADAPPDVPREDASGVDVGVEALAVPASRITGPVSATEGISDVRAEPGPPASLVAAASNPVPLGEAQLVDSKVGDVNGKPIFASRFLAPMAARFRQEASRKGLAEWQAFAKGEIERTLAGFIEDELLRAEALASLTPAQQQGLFAFVERVQRDVLSQNRGSREQASRRVFEEEGATLEEFVAARKERELINFQLDSQVRKRVSVTWRDIQQAYERNFDQFNSPPTFQFRLIRAFKSDEASVESIRSALAAGTPFAEVAATGANVHNRATQGLEAREMPRPGSEGGGEGTIEGKPDAPADGPADAPAGATASGIPADLELFPNPTLDAAAKALSVGDVVGPLDLGQTVAWLTLESIDQRSIPLYTAQLGIENVLRETRQRVERARYIDRLKSRANFSDPGETVSNLLAIATERFFEPAQSGASTPGGGEERAAP